MSYLGVEYGARYVLEGPPRYVNGNQIINNSFETNTAEWTFTAPSFTEGAATREALPFTGSHGEYVARLKGKKDATVTSRTMMFYYQSPGGGVVPGQKYSASIIANIVDNLAGGVQMYLTWVDSTGAAIETKGVTSLQTGTGIFEFALNGIVAPANAYRVNLVFQGTSTVSSDTFDIRVDAAAFRETGPRAVFNDSTDEDFVGNLSPESSGLDSPDIREDAADKVEEDGGVHGAFFAARRPVVLQGMIIASSASQRNERVDKLQRASLALRGDGTLSWTPTGGPFVYLTARRQQPLRITKGFVKEFQLPLVAADPRIYGASTFYSFSYTTPEFGLSSLKTPGTVSETALGGGTVLWTSPENAKTNDGVWATLPAMSGEKLSKGLTSSNNGFAIPAEAEIVGIEATVKARAGGEGETNGPGYGQVQLVKAGALVGTNKAPGEGATVQSWTGAESKFGSATDLWGTTWTPAQINAANFGLNVVAKHFASQPEAKTGGGVDYTSIKVFYKVGDVTHSQTITTNGSVATAPVIKVYGPTSTPGPLEVKNVTTGQTLKVATVLAGGQFLEIDFAKKSVLLNGATDEYKNVTFDPTSWWELQPGSNQLTLPPSSKVTLLVRDAWM